MPSYGSLVPPDTALHNGAVQFMNDDNHLRTFSLRWQSPMVTIDTVQSGLMKGMREVNISYRKVGYWVDDALWTPRNWTPPYRHDPTWLVSKTVDLLSRSGNMSQARPNTWHIYPSGTRAPDPRVNVRVVNIYCAWCNKVRYPNREISSSSHRLRAPALCPRCVAMPVTHWVDHNVRSNLLRGSETSPRSLLAHLNRVYYRQRLVGEHRITVNRQVSDTLNQMRAASGSLGNYGDIMSDLRGSNVMSTDQLFVRRV